LENDFSTYNITRSNQTAFDADVLSIREQLPHRSSTDTGLRCASGIHSNQLPTSIRSFVGKFCNERRPASVMHRLGQHSSSKTFDVQVFDNDCAEVSNEIERLPMLKLISQTIDSSVNFLEQSNRLPSAMRSSLSASYSTLSPTQFGFSTSIPARIRNWLARGQGSEGFETHVDSNSIVENGKRLCVAFNGETDVPLAAITFDRNRLDCARNRTMHLNCDLPDTLNPKNIFGDFDSVSVTWEGDAIKTAVRLESRISRSLVPFHPKEERFEGLVYPSKNVLAATKVRKPEVPCGSNILQLVRLGVVVDRDPLFPSIATFLQRTVVESAGFAKLPVECFQLGASRE